MAHNLATKTNDQIDVVVAEMENSETITKTDTAAFATVVRNINEKPWHGLGTFVDKAMTSAEAIKLAGLDYHVAKSQAYVNIKGKFTKIPEKYATVRTDNGAVLGGMVGARYQPVQNVEVFDFFDAIVGSNTAMFETAGALGAGEVIFVTAKLPSNIVLKKNGKEDVIEQYLFLKNSHDGSSAIICDFTPVRIVCNNTLQLALSGKSTNRVYIKHTNNAQERLREAHKIMGMIDKSSKEISLAFNKMVNVKVTDQKLKEYIAGVMSPRSEMISLADFDKFYSSKVIKLTDEIFEYAQSNVSQTIVTAEGTLFGAYNAITGYYQNMKEYDDINDKMGSLIMYDGGTAKKRSEKAFNMAVDLMGGIN